MLAGMAGIVRRRNALYVDASYDGKSRRFDERATACLLGLSAITAPSGFVNPGRWAVIIGTHPPACLVCISVEFIDRVMHVDDPVGAISFACSGTERPLGGVLSIGLFADGKE